MQSAETKIGRKLPTHLLCTAANGMQKEKPRLAGPLYLNEGEQDFGDTTKCLHHSVAYCRFNSYGAVTSCPRNGNERGIAVKNIPHPTEFYTGIDDWLDEPGHGEYSRAANRQLNNAFNAEYQVKREKPPHRSAAEIAADLIAKDERRKEYLTNKRKKRSQVTREKKDIELQLLKAGVPYACKKCGVTDNLQLDHIIPLAEGGDNGIENFQFLCAPCNQSKGVKIEDTDVESGEQIKLF